MNKKQFLELGKQLGLAHDKAHPSLALRGPLDGVPVFVAQYEMAMGRDPRPRPFTELRAEMASKWQGCLCGVSSEYRGDTGDCPFDERFYWRPQFGLPETSRPHYLASPRLRQALISLDASIAAAVGHKGIVLFQVDHLEAATRMMILTHLPQASLLERALRLLVEVAKA
jgi:hypothetical protein